MRYFLFPSYSVNGMLCAGSVILLTTCYTPVVFGVLYALCPMGMSCAHPFLFLLDVFPTSCPIVDVFPAGCPVGILCTHQFLFLVDVFPTSHPLQKLSVRAHIPSDISLPYLMEPGEVSICFYCFLLIFPSSFIVCFSVPFFFFLLFFFPFLFYCMFLCSLFSSFFFPRPAILPARVARGEVLVPMHCMCALHCLGALHVCGLGGLGICIYSRIRVPEHVPDVR